MKNNSTKKINGKGRPKGTKEKKLNDNRQLLRSRLVEETRETNLQDLSKETNINYKTLNAYINGSRTPKIDDLILLSKELDVSTDYLLGLQDFKTSNIDEIEILKRTHLSESSIKFLKLKNNDYLTKVINYLIGTYEGREVLECIGDFLFYLPIEWKIAIVNESNYYKSKKGLEGMIGYISKEEVEDSKLNRISEQCRKLKRKTSEYYDTLVKELHEKESEYSKYESEYLKQKENLCEFEDNALMFEIVGKGKQTKKEYLDNLKDSIDSLMSEIDEIAKELDELDKTKNISKKGKNNDGKKQ